MRSLTLVLGLSLLTAGSLFEMGCNDAHSENPTEQAEEPPSIPVEAAPVTTGDISAFFVGTATLETEGEAVVVAKAGGIVKAVLVEEGMYVKAGQPLAHLDDERLALEAARAEARLKKSRRDFERKTELHEKKLISAEEYERVKSEYEAQQADFNLTRLSLEYMTVRAPISGVVSERMIKVGNMVQTHEATFRITDFDPLLAVMHVPEREMSRLRVGQTAEVLVDALPERVFTGRIKRISPVVDPATGTFKVTIEVRDRTKALKPGMFGRIRIVYDTHRGALLVPREAVITEDDADAVFVVRDSMTFRRTVQTGYANSDYVEILDGLAPGDLVITTGQTNLRDSSKVEVIR
jgi:membrane fusion protein (multidrug efflux system)